MDAYVALLAYVARVGAGARTSPAATSADFAGAGGGGGGRDGDGADVVYTPLARRVEEIAKHLSVDAGAAG
eukprot:CAMPEP_0198340100 /NCGR_PEP_ID=MMETSP1450-20131203/42357_1 /TAXON_ID=753684 ORGANISM="Madagascaria erythrocladiodes, Strain CCMP3234" /NCGR_SAMPLE_ID=MMETSP1450 /ASSEMBLY_ACC=CAM_ASM_001115 /LENGTH=70 /DNA_ID=CAMNT_0044045065 /DNA_START=87 /DNA_END=296 /DNA_ORIENTATION=-